MKQLLAAEKQPDRKEYIMKRWVSVFLAGGLAVSQFGCTTEMFIAIKRTKGVEMKNSSAFGGINAALVCNTMK